MGVDHLQDEPKLILTYPHKSTFNRIGFSSMVSLSFIVRRKGMSKPPVKLGVDKSYLIEKERTS